MVGITDLHLHLDGSLSLESVKHLARITGVALPLTDEAIMKLVQVSDNCTDLNEYLEKFDFPLKLLQTREAITYAVQQLCSELEASGIKYAEIRFAPQLHLQKGLSQRQVVDAAVAGLKGSKNQLILCCMRGSDNDDLNMETVKVASEYLGKGVVLLDLAGAEGLFATSKYGSLFKYARDLRVPFTIHAGEADGAESVRLAVDYGAVRIGHGVRSVEDENVVKMLVERGIALEMCPTSNLNTKVCTDLAEYPIKKLLDAGVKVTVNTDNMTVSNTTIEKEFEMLRVKCNLKDDDIRQIIINGIECSRASAEYKRNLINVIRPTASV